MVLKMSIIFFSLSLFFLLRSQQQKIDSPVLRQRPPWTRRVELRHQRAQEPQHERVTRPVPSLPRLLERRPRVVRQRAERGVVVPSELDEARQELTERGRDEGLEVGGVRAEVGEEVGAHLDSHGDADDFFF